MTAAVVAVLASVLLVGSATALGIHDLLDPQGIGDIAIGILAGAIYYGIQRVRMLEHDTLTGLYGRSVIENRLVKISRARRDVTVAIIDINGLKRINDKYGHAGGDAMLSELGHRLLAYKLRHPRHIIGRLHGDEFIIIAMKTDIFALRNTLAELLDLPHIFGDWPIASCGIARARHGHRIVLKCADLALYRAKHAFANDGRLEISEYDSTLDGIPND